MELRIAAAATQDSMCDRPSQILTVQRSVSDVSHDSCQARSAVNYIASTIRMEHSGQDGDLAPPLCQFSTVVSTLEDVLKSVPVEPTNSVKKQRSARKQRQTQSGTVSEPCNNEALSSPVRKAGKHKITVSKNADLSQPLVADFEVSLTENRRRKRRTDAAGGDKSVTDNCCDTEKPGSTIVQKATHSVKKTSRKERLAARKSKVASQRIKSSQQQLESGASQSQVPAAAACSATTGDEALQSTEALAVQLTANQSSNLSNTREARVVQTDMSCAHLGELLAVAESSAHAVIFARPRALPTTRIEATPSTSASLFDASVWLGGPASSITQSLDSRIETLRCEAVRLKSECEQVGRELTRHETLQPEAVKLLQELLLQKSDIEKEQLRERCSLNKYRIGEFQYLRQGSALVEQLTEGVSFQKIRKRRNEISSELIEVEKRRRAIAKMSRDKQKQQAAAASDSQTVPVATGANGTTGVSVSLSNMNSSSSLEELSERDEILKLRTAALRREDAELQRELDRLSRDRLVHSKQLKRIEAEDASRFQSTLEKPRVLHERYLLLELIGKGGFSEVHRAYDLVAMRYVACKIHEHQAASSREYRDSYVRHVVREIEIQKTLFHPHIVSIYDAFDIDANALCTVLEHVHGHDLDFHLRQHQMIAEREARAIVLQIVAALVYLNEQNPAIIHYDLKPANILLSLEPNAHTNTFSIKITDFGLAKLVQRHKNSHDTDADASGTELTSQGVGTYWYLPPECFFGIGPNAFAPADEDGTPQSIRISNKVDVWSLGVVFYNMVYGCKPFGHGVSQQEILRTNLIVTKGRDVTFPAKPHVSLEARRFIMRCLTYEKECRPDVFAIAKDSYLQRDFTARKRNVASRRVAKDVQTASSSMQQSVNNVQRTGVSNADDVELQDERDEAGESDEQDGDEEREDAETA